MSAESWATLAMVAALGLERLAKNCNLYPVGVKTLHCQASDCFKFDVERSSGACSPVTTPAKELSGVHPPPALPIASNELVEIARRLSITLPETQALQVPPSVEKVIG